jgi:hypothetical protein
MDHEMLTAGSEDGSISPSRSLHRNSGGGAALGRASNASSTSVGPSRSPSRRRVTGGGLADADLERGGLPAGGQQQTDGRGQPRRTAAAVMSRIGEVTRETLGLPVMEDSDDDDRML